MVDDVASPSVRSNHQEPNFEFEYPLTGRILLVAEL